MSVSICSRSSIVPARRALTTISTRQKARDHRSSARMPSGPMPYRAKRANGSKGPLDLLMPHVAFGNVAWGGGW